MYEYTLEKDDKMMIATSDGLKADLFRAEKKWEESFQLFEKSFQEFEAVDARHARTTLRGKVWVLRRVLRCTFPQNNAESNITYLARAMDWQTLKST
jgi:hypothetical protein